VMMHTTRRTLALERLEERILLSAVFPTNYDQYLLELINRGRMDPAAEAARYGTSLNEGLPAGTISTAPKQPVAMNPYLTDAARDHSQWMLNTDTFSHTGSGGSNPGQRMGAAGYSFSPAPWSWGENLAWIGTTGSYNATNITAESHENLYVDYNFPGRGHRTNQMNPKWREVGCGVVFGVFSYDGTDYNSVMVSEDFAYVSSNNFITGVAYNDNIVTHNNFYTPGEGISGVTITAVRQSDSATFSTTTWGSGGYSLPVPNGTYTVTGSGAALGFSYTFHAVVMGSLNVKRDFTTDLGPSNQPPGISTLSDAPDPVSEGDTITVSAVGVSDPDGSVTSVSFYRDANGNGIGDPGERLGTDTSSSGGWKWSGAVTWSPGTHTYLARATDNGTPALHSPWVSTIGTVDEAPNVPPTIAALGDSPDPVTQGTTITLTATGVSDPDGSVASVAFYRDANSNGIGEPGELLGTDTSASGGWTWSGTANWSVGMHTYLAQATDDGDPILTSNWASTTGNVGEPPNYLPVIGSLSDSPDPVAPGATLTLTASGVSDPDGSVVSVAFYRDANTNGVGDPGELLGTDTSSAGGWAWSGTVTWADGTYTYLAQATDDGDPVAVSDWAATTGTVETPPNVLPTIASLSDSPDPVQQGSAWSLTATGVADADGSVVSVAFYRDANYNGVGEPGELLGTDTSASGGWAWSGTANWFPGVHTYLAQATDDAGPAGKSLWASTTGLVTAVPNEPPTIASLSDSPDPVTQGGSLTLVANGVTDPVGNVASVAFYRDSNSNGIGEPGELLGTDTSAAGGWTWTGTANWSSGSHTYLARATDDGSPVLTSDWVATSGRLNVPPTIGSLTDSPDLVIQGAPITLTAGGVADPDGTVAAVYFYRDANFNGLAEVDEEIGRDESLADGWAWTGAVTWGTGMHTYIARPKDDDGVMGGSADTNGMVNVPPTIAVGEPFPGTAHGLGETAHIAWIATDPDDNALIDLYWDADTSWANNTAPNEGTTWGRIRSGLAEDGPAAWDWTVDAPVGGSYHFCAEITDGLSTSRDHTALTFAVVPPPGTAVGYVWQDTDGDGLRDFGEAPLPGRTVYADVNQDGEHSVGERLTLTEPDGSYSLPLLAGTYQLRTLPVSQWAGTTPAFGYHTVAVTSEVTTGDWNFGSVPLPTLAMALVDDTGMSASDALTNDATPGVEFTTNTAGTLTVDWDGDAVADDSWAITGAGVWTFSASADVPDGQHIATATFMDAIEHLAFAALPVTVDTTGPTASDVVHIWLPDRSASPVEVQFTDAWDMWPATVTDPTNYALTESGGGADLTDRILDVAYDAGTGIATLTVQPALGDGDYALTIKGTATVRDAAGNALADGADVTLTFAVIAPPEFIDPPEMLIATEDIAFAFDFQTDDEIAGADVTYTLVNAPDWLLMIDPATGLIGGTPVNGDSGLATVTIKASAPGQGIGEQVFEIQVQNTAPEFQAPPYELSASHDVPFSYDFDTDDEGPAGQVIYWLTGAPAWMGFDDATLGTISGTPVVIQPGDVQITIWAQDAFGGQSGHSFTLHQLNGGPTIALDDPDPTAPLQPGDVFTISWVDDDPESDASISLFWDVDTNPGNNTPGKKGVDWDEIVVGISEDDAVDAFDWPTTPGAHRSVYLSATITDGILSGADYTRTAITFDEPPSITLTNPPFDATVAPGTTYRVAWTDDDDDDNAVISLFWDADTDSANNTLGTQGAGWGLIIGGLREDGADSYDWTVAGVADGDWYLLATISDGIETAEDYSDTVLTVTQAVGTWQRGDVVVTALDLIGATDIRPSDIKVTFGWTGDSVQSIVIGGAGAGSLDGLGLVISGATSVGYILDLRTRAPGDLAFIVADCPIGLLLLNSGVAGRDLNGMEIAGLAMPADVDGDGDTSDLTGIYSEGRLNVAIIGGEIVGDIVADSTALMLTRGGGLAGDLTLAGDAGVVLLDGDLTGDMRIGGALNFVSVRNVTDARIDVAGRLGFANVTGDWTDSSLHAGQLGFVRVAGTLSATEDGMHEIHADTGSFFLLEGTSFHLMNYPFPGSLADEVIGRVRVWVG